MPATRFNGCAVIHRYLCVFCLAVSVASPATAQNQRLVGRKVMTIKWDTEFKEGATVTFKSDLGKVYEVDRVNGKWLLLTGGGREGWVKRAEVVPWEEAIDHFSRLIRQDPSSTNYYHRAIAWEAKGELDIALGDYNEAIRLDPKLAAAYLHRGIAWNDKGEYDKAIADHNEAIRLDPKNAATYYNRGTIRQSKGEYDKAIADYNEAIRLDPKLALAYCNRGAGWKAKGEYYKAIADYNEAIRLDPKDALPYMNVARLLALCPDAKYRNGRQAVEYATKSCELTNWKQARSIALLAMAYTEAGDSDQAVQWATKAVGMVSESEKPAYKKILNLCRAGKPYR